MLELDAGNCVKYQMENNLTIWNMDGNGSGTFNDGITYSMKVIGLKICHMVEKTAKKVLILKAVSWEVNSMRLSEWSQWSWCCECLRILWVMAKVLKVGQWWANICWLVGEDWSYLSSFLHTSSLCVQWVGLIVTRRLLLGVYVLRWSEYVSWLECMHPIWCAQWCLTGLTSLLWSLPVNTEKEQIKFENVFWMRGLFMWVCCWCVS